jgi:hypothetical protein
LWYPRQIVSGRFVSFVVAVALVAAGSASPAYAAVRLVLPSTGLPGLRATSSRAATARSDLAAGLRPALARTARAAEFQTIALAGRGLKVRSDAFVFSSPARAAQVLAAWRHAHRGVAQRIARARGVLRVTRSGHTTTVTVVWPEGPKLGAIVLRSSASDAQTLAVGYAELADGALRSRLPTTAWGRVLDEVRDNGTVSRSTALQAFAVAYGRLPGVHAPAGRATKIIDGTIVRQWLRPYLPTLTAAQRAIVDRALGLPAPHAHAHAASLGDPYFTPDSKIQGLADSARVDEAAHVGALPLEIVAGITTDPAVKGEKGNVLADATPFDAQQGTSGTPTTCRIRFTTFGIAQDAAYKREIAAHEVFHCFQFAWRGYALPDAWITEGTAEWVADTVAPAPLSDDGWPLEYIDTSNSPLFSRAYDAIGFWGHVQDSEPDLWTRLRSVVLANSNNAAYQAAVPDQDTFLDGWGTSVFRVGSQGVTPVWQMTSPVTMPVFLARTPAQMVEYTSSANDPVSAPAYTTAQYRITPPADSPLMHTGIQGVTRLGVLQGYTDLRDQWFCTSTAPCVCPKGTEGEPPQTLPLTVPALLGLSGQPPPDEPSGGDIRFEPLSKYCQKKQQQQPPGIDNGDPYMKTFDGGSFGLQQAGEFTIVKSKTDNLEIQGRQQPYSNITHPEFAHELAMNTAFAMRVGPAIVQVNAGHQEALFVDRRAVSASEGQTISLNGGGTVAYGRFFTRITWPDGTQAVVLLIGTEGVNLFVRPAASRAGHLTGLMGNDDGQSANDYVGRDGHAYPASVVNKVGLFGSVSKHAREVVYAEFGHSWRITQRQSLFVYPPGRTTRSYDVKGFPQQFVFLGILSPAQRRAAGRACRHAHVTDPILLAGCELDVGASGRKQFATSDGQLQTAVDAPPQTPTPTTPQPTAPKPLVSAIPWTQLSSQTDTSTIVQPSVATIGPQAVAAYRRGSDQGVEAATFTPSAAGVGAVAHNAIVSGFVATMDPVLLAAPGGGLQALVPADHTIGSDPLNGVVSVGRNADGSFNAPSPLRSSPDSGITSATLASDGTTPLWAVGGGLTVFQGATAHDLSASSPGSAYSPTFGRDASGRLWLAWYVISLNQGVSGLYMMQLDPATGVALGPAVQAPASEGPNTTGTVPLACAAQCRLAYVDTATTPSSIVTWAPGESATTTLFAGVNAGQTQSPRTPLAAYTADGRLWVAWTNFSDEQEYAQLGSGPPVEMPIPAPYNAPAQDAATTIGSRLVLVANLTGNTGATAIYATTLDPPAAR